VKGDDDDECAFAVTMTQDALRIRVTPDCHDTASETR
jgi:hypothetical protein